MLARGHSGASLNFSLVSRMVWQPRRLDSSIKVMPFTSLVMQSMVRGRSSDIVGAPLIQPTAILFQIFRSDFVGRHQAIVTLVLQDEMAFVRLDGKQCNDVILHKLSRNRNARQVGKFISTQSIV